VLKLFMVPIDGGTPRVYGAIPSFSGFTGSEALSPDGKRLGLLSGNQRNTTIYELDLTPILQSIRKQ
jgi:hypothetical protein